MTNLFKVDSPGASWSNPVQKFIDGMDNPNDNTTLVWLYGKKTWTVAEDERCVETVLCPCKTFGWDGTINLGCNGCDDIEILPATICWTASKTEQ
jgi:hypothetical protein